MMRCVPLRVFTATTLLFALGCGDDDDSPAPIPTEEVSEPTDEGTTPPPADIPAAPDTDTAAPSDTPPPTPDTDTGAPTTMTVQVEVTVDGEHLEGVLVVQGGREDQWHTDAEGKVTVEVDPTVKGDKALMASHPECRIGTVQLDPLYPDSVQIPLVRYDASDNEEYEFLDPGVPGDSWIIEKCGHCHITIQETWYPSAHRTSANNPAVQDVYAGTAATADTEAACQALGGTWKDGPQLGEDGTTKRCYVTDGVEITGGTAGCADCHAPGIDGKVGGRGLEEARGYAYEYGVHCDVCHRVDAVDLTAEARGVGGALKVMRPSEPPKFPDLAVWAPMTFGPSVDVANVLMGSVPREHFRQARFCAGCHEQYQAVLVGPGIDQDRWPDGKLPVMTTHTEWEASPLGGISNCQSCHMPIADKSVTNGADLQLLPEPQTGISGGWIRPHGSVREHRWLGPRTPMTPGGPTMLDGAVKLDLEAEVAGGELVATVTLTNVVGAHAVPTGEALRSMVLRVDATCEGAAIPPTGGDAIPDFGGYLARKEKGEDWTTWPGAEIGQILRVVTRPGGWHDYSGFGSFGDGTFSAAQKGMAVEHVAGTATIIGVADGVVTLDAALPNGDVAYLVAPDAWPEEGAPAAAAAGAPGFGFARVLTGPDGDRMVPHFRAVDVASDNRLGPGAPWTSTHRFADTCQKPLVRAALTYRAYPQDLARARGWTVVEQLVNSETKQLDLGE